MKTIAILAASAVTVSALSHAAEDMLVKQEWEAFKLTYKKRYTADEEPARFTVFKENLELAAAYKRADPTADFGVTKFADLTQEEFSALYLTYTPQGAAPVPVRAKQARPTTSPQSFNWVSQGATTPVKDQGQCGSCWAFSVVTSVESASYLAGHPMQELSPQALVSCDSDCYGCSGCWSYTALDWIIAEGGVPTTDNYPYTSGTTQVNGQCQAWTPAAFTQVASYDYAVPPCTSGKCSSQDKDAAAQVLSTTQPLSICVDASKWSLYKGGVMTEASCSSAARKQDHCVSLVGFTDLDSSSGYWVVRNQWGTGWGVPAVPGGEDGYIYLSTSSSNGNTCGLLNTPIVVNMA